MGATSIMSTLSGRITIPPHVVHRTFASETVLLNISTGQYHGVNAVGGTMLEVLERVGDIKTAITELSEHFRVPRERIATDLDAFLRGLLERGLVEHAAA